jgi:hypothetical protein
MIPKLSISDLVEGKEQNELRFIRWSVFVQDCGAYSSKLFILIEFKIETIRKDLYAVGDSEHRAEA